MGVYETQSGEVVCIIDARATTCDLVTHSVDAVVTPDNLNDLDDDEPAHQADGSSRATH